MLDAARDLVLQSGTRAATIDRVVAASGAPKGSVYHRFATIDDLLIATWLRAVRRTQDAFLEAIIPFPVDSPLKQAVLKHANLVAYRDRIRARWWKDLTSPRGS